MTTRVVGILHSGTAQTFATLVQTTITTIKDGYPDIVTDIRYAEDDIGQLEDDADDLVDNGVDIIVAAGGPQSAIAAMNATQEISIVFTTVADPVGLGLVDNINTPGRNLTGMAGQTSELDPERMNILYEFIHGVRPGKNYGVLVNPGRSHNREQYEKLKNEAANHNPKLNLKRRRANSSKSITRAFKAFADGNVSGAIVTADSFFNNNRGEVVQRAANRAIPTIYQWRAFVEAGGLISYGPSIEEAYTKAGDYAARILNGTSPSTLACSKPDPNSYELVVNKNVANNTFHIATPNNMQIRGKTVILI
jgi:putative tryptophan/tyrosine transport system substrate-binding protein